MFTQAPSSSETITNPPNITSPTSPSRSGRLRTLNYLRNYAQSPAFSRSTSCPTLDPTLSLERSIESSTSNRNSVGWLPIASGHNGVSAVPSQAQPSAIIPAAEMSIISSNNAELTSSITSAMARSRAASGTQPAQLPSSTSPARDHRPPHAPVNATTIENLEPNGHPPTGEKALTQMPSIRFVPHHDPRASRPSLVFQPVTRILPIGSAVIRVGRYSERDNLPVPPPNAPTSAPVGFKSKVVSRRHCEFWCTNGQWHIKDVGSSSGTFLNHIRLSQPGVESKPWPVGDGDVVQLGIDFRGGEEMIFRCVKIRLECNRGWQKALNSFNTSAHKRLRALADGGSKSKSQKDSDTASTTSSECSICLMSVAPCQALFVAPCSHVWHYKCIRPILNGPTWPSFLCPNCRMVADLEADVEDPENFEQWEQLEEITAAEADRAVTPKIRQQEQENSTSSDDSPEPRRVSTPEDDGDHSDDPAKGELSCGLAAISLGRNANDNPLEQSTNHRRDITMIGSAVENTLPRQASNSSLSRRVPSSVRSIDIIQHSSTDRRRDTTPPPRQQSDSLDAPVEIVSGPMTPRNDAGPFVFDGSAGRSDRSDIANLTQALEADA